MNFNGNVPWIRARGRSIRELEQNLFLISAHDRSIWKSTSAVGVSNFTGISVLEVSLIDAFIPDLRGYVNNEQ